MLYKTRGIVFRTVKYSDNSSITTIFTEKFGLRTYMIKGLGSSKTSLKKGAIQNLNLLNLVVYEKEKNNLQTIKEIESILPYHSIPFNIRKTSIIMFLNELLFHSIKEEAANQNLFDYVYHGLLEFDDLETGIENFHLQFIVGLTRFLGFFPRNNYSNQNMFFDLQEGVFVSDQPMHSNYLNSELSEKLNLMQQGPECLDQLFLHSSARNELLERFLLYFRLHLPSFGELKSHLVLKEVLA